MIDSLPLGDLAPRLGTTALAINVQYVISATV